MEVAASSYISSLGGSDGVSHFAFLGSLDTFESVFVVIGSQSHPAEQSHRSEKNRLLKDKHRLMLFAETVTESWATRDTRQTAAARKFFHAGSRNKSTQSHRLQCKDVNDCGELLGELFSRGLHNGFMRLSYYK